MEHTIYSIGWTISFAFNIKTNYQLAIDTRQDPLYNSKTNPMEILMNTRNKLTLGLLTLLLSSAVALSSALASTPATEVAEEAVKQTTGDMAKEAAGQVADSAKEKAIGMAKEQASSAVDSGLDKVAGSLNPTEKAADAATEAVEEASK